MSSIDPNDFYNNLASRMNRGVADFEISSRGRIAEIKPGKKDAAQREKDNVILSAAFNILRNALLSKEEIKRKKMAGKVLKRLKEQINAADVDDVLFKMVKAAETLTGTGRLMRAQSQILTTEFRIKMQSKLEETDSFPKVRKVSEPIIDKDSSSPEKSNEESADAPKPLKGSDASPLRAPPPLPSTSQIPIVRTPSLLTSSKPASAPALIEIASSASPARRRLHHHLQQSNDVYPEQEKMKKAPRPRSDSKKKMKALEKRVEEYTYLGPQAFEAQVKKKMEETLNGLEVPHNIGLDIFRYLSRNGIILSTNDEPEDSFITKTSSTEEHVIISERFKVLMNFLIAALPDQLFTSCQVPSEGIQARKQKLYETVKDLLEGCKESTGLQNKIQEFIVNARQDAEHPELRFLSKILQSIAQDGPNKISAFMLNTGMLHAIDLERLPQDICLHLEKGENKLYVIYKTYLKDRDLSKRSAAGDPMLFLINSKVVFTLDLDILDSDWLYKEQILTVGLPEKPSKKGAHSADTLFKTFFALGLEPVRRVCSSTVPDRLSRM